MSSLANLSPVALPSLPVPDAQQFRHKYRRSRASDNPVDGAARRPDEGKPFSSQYSTSLRLDPPPEEGNCAPPPRPPLPSCGGVISFLFRACFLGDFRPSPRIVRYIRDDSGLVCCFLGFDRSACPASTKMLGLFCLPWATRLDTNQPLVSPWWPRRSSM